MSLNFQTTAGIYTFCFFKGGGGVQIYRAKRQYEFLTLSRGHDCQLITF